MQHDGQNHESGWSLNLLILSGFSGGSLILARDQGGLHVWESTQSLKHSVTRGRFSHGSSTLHSDVSLHLSAFQSPFLEKYSLVQGTRIPEIIDKNKQIKYASKNP